MIVAVQNKSTLVSDHDAQVMSAAVRYQIWRDVCPAWRLVAPAVLFYPRATHIPPGAYVVTLYDDSDQADALGWHTEDAGAVYGRVFARPVLNAGGKALTGQLSVSTVLSHEVIEGVVDPTVSDWSDAGNGNEYAKEACDACEGDTYDVKVSTTGDVSVSNFLLPAWFDPQATGKVDFMGTVPGPFKLAPGGYAVYRANTAAAQEVFGDQYPEWKRDAKAHPLARSYRRRVPSAVRFGWHHDNSGS